MIDNLVILRGKVSAADAYFDRLKTDGGSLPLLRLRVSVPRGPLQKSHPGFSCDAIRAVAYGELAERTLALLKGEVEVEIVGWLQSRKVPKDKGSLTEVVSWRITVSGCDQAIIQPGLRERIQTIAAQRGLPADEIINCLLAPQVEALECCAALVEEAEWKSESLNAPHSG